LEEIGCLLGVASLLARNVGQGFIPARSNPKEDALRRIKIVGAGHTTARLGVLSPKK
jgi:hypothetical protein